MRATRIAKFAVLAIAAVALFGFIVMSLWNWILPPVTGWHPITYWQALGLLLLSKILFGSFRAHGAHWRRRWLHRYAQMTPEEREKFREAMRSRCGYRGDDVTPTSSGA
jgi:hypothetical protein